MSWSDNNNGPWGRRPTQKKPSQATGFDGIDSLLKKGRERFKDLQPPSNQHQLKLGYIIVAAIVVFWLSTGLYRVQEGEEAVVLRFGKIHRVMGPGLRYHLPTPFESHEIAKVAKINVIDGGVEVKSAKLMRSEDAANLMLTGDENILKLRFTVQWVIKDIRAHLYNDMHPGHTVQLAANSAVREVIAQTKLADALTTGKNVIIIQSKALLQKLCDEYGLGIEIIKVNLEEVNPPDAVIDAFRDVQRARADRERKINDAYAYQNSIIPVARGEGKQELENAEGEKAAAVDLALGEAGQFESVLKEYLLAPDITIKRLQIQNAEKIYSKLPKMILSHDGGVMPYLPLDALKPKPTQPVSEAK